MKLILDAKTLAIGLVLGLAVMGVCGAAYERGSSAGRFTIVSNEHSALVLDTQTGQVWAQDPGLLTDSAFYKPKIGGHK